jgi:hypothetical protein
LIIQQIETPTETRPAQAFVRRHDVNRPRRPVTKVPADELAALEQEFGPYLATMVAGDVQRNWWNHVS